MSKPQASKRVEKALAGIFLAIFCYFFALTLGGVVFGNKQFSMNSWIVFPLALAYMVFIYLVYRLINKHASFVQKHYRHILLFGFTVIAAANLVFGLMLRYRPVFDLGAIFTGASEWSAAGSFMDKMEPTVGGDYFYYFPNNLGAMTLLFWVFKLASIFGITDYYLIAMLLNGVLCLAAMLVTILVCKEIFGSERSIIALAFMLLFPPFWFISAVFYTDSLSLLFPVLIVYLYLLYAKSKPTDTVDMQAGKGSILARIGGKRRLILAAMMGFAAVVGILIKHTVVIAVVAVLIYELCSRKWKSTLVIFVAFALQFAVIIPLFNGYFNKHIDREKAARMKTPYLHWVMMSLTGEGRYNPTDYNFTRSFDDPDERDAAILGEISRRLTEPPITELFTMFNAKLIITFGDGTLGQSDFLDDNPAHDTALHKFVLYNSDGYNIYRHLCSAAFYGMIAYMLLGAVVMLLRLRREVPFYLPQLCVFGVLVFFLFWEVTARYVTNFVPLIIVSALFGVEALFHWRNHHRESTHNS